MKRLKFLLTLLLVVVGVNSAWAQVQTGRVLTAAEINQGGVEIILYLPYSFAAPNDRYFQSNAAGDGFISLNQTGNSVNVLSDRCVFVVEKVTDGIVLKHKATGKYVGNTNNKPAPVEGVGNAIVFNALQSTNTTIENFGNATYNGLQGVRFQRQNPTNYMNSNGPQWAGGTGCWSLYVPLQAVYPSILAENYVYTIQPSTNLTKYLSTTEADDGGFKTYCWSDTPEKFALFGSTDAWKLQSTLNGKYVGKGAQVTSLVWDCMDNSSSTWKISEVADQEDVFMLQVNGSDLGGYLGWQTHNGQEGVLFNNKTADNTWKFTKVGAYVTIKYMEGTNERGTHQAGIDFGHTIEAVATDNVPNGYYLTPGQTYASVSNGGDVEFSVNVTPLPACYTLTYVDENGVALTAPVKAEVSSGISVFTGGLNKVSVDAALTRFIGTQDYLIRDFVSATANGIEYPSWDDLQAAVTTNADVTVKLATKVKAGKFYTFRHAGNTPSYHIFDTGEVLNADTYNKANDRYVFTFEDAGNGRFYIRNAGTNRYVKRTGASGIINDQNIPTLATLDSDNCLYYVTNANTNTGSRTDIYGIVDAVAVTNPITGGSNQRFWHTNGQNGEKAETSHKVVRWSVSAENFHSQWYIEEVPVITLKFKIDGVEYEEGISYTAPKSGVILPDGKVLSTFTGISFDDYVVEEYELDGYKYTNRTQFFQDCHRLTKDGEAVITLRPKRAGEVDVTLQLWKAKGKGYVNEDMSDATPKEGNNWADNLKVWALTVGDTDEDIKGSSIPTNIDFKIVSSEDTGVGGMISNTGGNHAHYHYGHVITNPWCICFQDVSAAHTGTTFTMSVAEHETDPNQNYYILQYTLGGFPGASSNLPTLTNSNGGMVQLGSPDSGARQYNLTDTPAAHSAAFTVTSSSPNTVAANYFRVRIVNETYLLNSMDRGEMIIEDALYDSNNIQAVGYPVATSAEYRGLKDAYDTFKAEGGRTLDNYLDMLQAYSNYISCTNVNMPTDCDVYTLSFIKSNGKQVLVNNGENGLEIVPYTEENKAKPSARWISHTKDGYNNQNEPVKKLILVNKKDGKYLQVSETSVGLSETYDAATTSFNVRVTYQDMSDYMASATDEKLLGALCIKNSAENSKLTIQNEDEIFVIKDAAYFDETFSSAMRIENVDGGGNTYSMVSFHPAADQKFYATYYGFYPVAKPDDAEMYYVTGTKESNGDNYLVLKPVQEDVIKPEFGVILISDNEYLYADDVEGEPTHLHVGEYTDAKKQHIEELLDENGQNLLRGNFREHVALGDAETDGDIYTLSQVNNRVGFYQYTGDELPVGKAFYVDTTRSGIRGFIFEKDGGIVNRLDLIENTVGANDKVFDLSGRRVMNADKGFYIVNGKKVIK